MSDEPWHYGRLNADEIDALRRTDDPLWVVWKHLPPDDPDVCVISAVTGDGPTSEANARLFAALLNERQGCADDDTDDVLDLQDIAELNLKGSDYEGWCGL